MQISALLFQFLNFLFFFYSKFYLKFFMKNIFSLLYFATFQSFLQMQKLEISFYMIRTLVFIEITGPLLMLSFSKISLFPTFIWNQPGISATFPDNQKEWCLHCGRLLTLSFSPVCTLNFASFDSIKNYLRVLCKCKVKMLLTEISLFLILKLKINEVKKKEF